MFDFLKKILLSNGNHYVIDIFGYHIHAIRFQTLEKAQQLYNLLPAAERDVDIDMEDFNPQKSSASIKLYAAKTESKVWEPELDEDPFWLEDKKCFIRVRSINHL